MAEGGQKLDLSCSICFEEYGTPKVLTCGHTFCSQCLSTMCDDEHSPFLRCPKCRKEVTLPESGKISDLPTNFELMAIIDDRSQQKPDSGNDVNRETKHPEREAHCKMHDKSKEFYCKSCKIQVCTQCLLSQHRLGEHNVVTISDFAKNLLVELQELKEKLLHFQKNEKSLSDNMMESENTLEKHYSSIQARINASVVEEQEKIRAKGDALLKELADKKAANFDLLADLKTQRSSISSLSKETEEKCTKLEQEFTKLNFSGESELEEVSKDIETLNIQIKFLVDKRNKTMKSILMTIM